MMRSERWNGVRRKGRGATKETQRREHREEQLTAHSRQLTARDKDKANNDATQRTQRPEHRGHREEQLTAHSRQPTARDKDKANKTDKDATQRAQRPEHREHGERS